MSRPTTRPSSPARSRRSASPHRKSAPNSGQSSAQIGRMAQRDSARWVVGIHSCTEALKVRPKGVREIWLRSDWTSSQALRELQAVASDSRIAIREKTPGQLDAVGSGHQGVAVAMNQSPQVDWEKLKLAETSLVLILDGIEDPHNLGAMLRTAWLAGADAIFTPTDRAVGLTPAVCKVASGGAEHVPVEAETNIGTLISKLKETGFWVYGLSEAGRNRPWDLKLAGKIAWVIGSEAGGIRTATERACDELVRLPQASTGSSYNASIACAMALSETCRQIGKPS